MLKIKKPIHINTKCFQFNCVSWSNLYLGIVPLAAIAKTVKNTAFKIKTKNGNLYTFQKINASGIGN
jgi:hypothetical protein